MAKPAQDEAHGLFRHQVEAETKLRVEKSLNLPWLFQVRPAPSHVLMEKGGDMFGQAIGRPEIHVGPLGEYSCPANVPLAGANRFHPWNGIQRVHQRADARLDFG